MDTLLAKTLDVGNLSAKTLSVDTLGVANATWKFTEIQTFLLEKGILPVIVALATYIAVDRLGEWRRRKTYSRLGVAIIESLQEEVQVGLKNLERNATAVHDPGASPIPFVGFPHHSWDGMTSIPDEALLRIIETSKNGKFERFHPRDCRTHCKNYFEHIRRNYQLAVESAFNLAKSGKNWRPPIQNVLQSAASIDAVEGVNQMLEDAKNLLNKNSLKWCPK